MAQRRAVALLIETSNSYARGLLDGIVAYVQQNANWSIYLPEQERGAPPPSWLGRWKGDGILARIETATIARAVRRTKLPVVDLSAAKLVPHTPWVETNDKEIARLAAEHLLERGFTHFAFCGDSGFNWSVWRQEAFGEIIEKAGFECGVFESTPRYDPKFSWNREKQRFKRWIERLPKPIGIMACYDIKAQQLLDVCRELDVAVPEEVAVIGVDNDALLCELTTPPLTSVIPNSKRAGYDAAALLDKMMSGASVEAEPLLIQPLGIQERQSTDVLAIEDPDVVQVLRFIRENAFQNINVNDILAEVPLSRRMLEHRFQRLLGRTPHQEIQRVRFDRVKELLFQTDFSLAEIAHRTGFEHPEYLTVAFKRLTGENPREYRKRVKAKRFGAEASDA